MDFGQPNVEIGQKMANDQLLFLALMISDMEVNYIVLYSQNSLRVKSFIDTWLSTFGDKYFVDCKSIV